MNKPLAAGDMLPAGADVVRRKDVTEAHDRRGDVKKVVNMETPVKVQVATKLRLLMRAKPQMPCPIITWIKWGSGLLNKVEVVCHCIEKRKL